MKTRKPSAADRTLDMYASAIAAAGPAKIEDATDEDCISGTDAKDKPRTAETIESASQRWRDTAFYGQELVSKHFNSPLEDKSDMATFRLTQKDGWMFLEQYRNSKDGMAYSWTGVMFRESDLYELTGLFVKASKEKQARELQGT